jgi:hypothetical protein
MKTLASMETQRNGTVLLSAGGARFWLEARICLKSPLRLCSPYSAAQSALAKLNSSGAASQFAPPNISSSDVRRNQPTET